MVKDPAPANFWRSAKWVIERNRNTVNNHSAQGRSYWRKYHKTEKGRKRTKRYSEQYEKSPRRKYLKVLANLRYEASLKGRLNHAARERERNKRLRFARDPLREIRKMLNVRTTRILGAVNGKL